jgi:hypothetical protein
MNGTVIVQTAGLMGWFLAATSGLPRSGTIASHLELREGLAGERWTRHLKPGRRQATPTWKVRPDGSHVLVEKLGPVSMTFATHADASGTSLVLTSVQLGRLRLRAGIVHITADATQHEGSLTTVVHMSLLHGRLGSLWYTSELPAT